MSRYELSPKASSQLRAILQNALEHRSIDKAIQLSHALELGLQQLAETPGLGHRREDITPHDVYFFLVDSFYIVYKCATDPLRVVTIVHASRNLRRMLR